MSPKQTAFVKHYIVCKNGTQAAKLAGYSERTAAVIGSENLQKPYIKAAIDEGLAKTYAKLDISAEAILTGIANIAYDVNAAAKDKLKAFELLGKYRKLFTDVVHNTVEAQVTTVSAEQVAAAMDAVDRKF